jgi:UDP-N-acetylglucosamine:LPS N-acetylglucosamine transferase
MKKPFLIDIVTGQGKNGHYATYHAIRAIAEQQHLPWQLQVINLDDIMTELSQQNQVKNAYEMLGFSAYELYNRMVKSGWTCLCPLLMRLNKRLIKLNYKKGVSLLEQHWRERQPDLVVSVMPLFNQAIWESIQRAKPGTPVVTLLTDFADCPPAYWIEPNTQNYLICGTERAAAQARNQGVSEERILNTSGLVVHPRFYQKMADHGARRALMRRLGRQRLGLDSDRLTGLVLFGTRGSQTMLKIAKRLECFHNLQLIFLCGHNQAVAAALRQLPREQKRCIVPFTQEIPDYMQLADFFIGNPDNVSLSEALMMNLPVIVERNIFTLPQERYAADWIQAQEIGLVISSFRDIRQAVATFLKPETFARYHANVATVNNQAVFEIPYLLYTILATHQQPIAPYSKNSRT